MLHRRQFVAIIPYFEKKFMNAVLYQVFIAAGTEALGKQQLVIVLIQAGKGSLVIVPYGFPKLIFHWQKLMVS
jgi:hypothetical protein